MKWKTEKMSLSEIFFCVRRKKEDEMLSQLLQWPTFSHLEGYVLIWLGGLKKKIGLWWRRHFGPNVKPFCPTDCKGLLNTVIWQLVDVVAPVVVAADDIAAVVAPVEVLTLYNKNKSNQTGKNIVLTNNGTMEYNFNQNDHRLVVIWNM